MQADKAATSRHRKIRSQTYSSDSGQNKKCGLIILHRDDLIQRKVAIQKCHLLGYKPLVLDKPSKLDEPAEETITRIKHLLCAHTNLEISFALVEANYSSPTNISPNVDLIQYLLTRLPITSVFITSTTEKCIENIENNPKFNGIIIANPSYSNLKEHLPDLNKSYCLSSSEVDAAESRNSAFTI